MLLEVFDLVYQDHDQIILDHVNLKFNEPGLVWISGKSGSGKTTLLHLIGHLISSSNGEVLIEGISLNNQARLRKLNLYQQEISFIFQGYHLIEGLTVMENLALFGFEQNRIHEALIKVKMEEFINEKIENLSGGQKQRIAIVRAILIHPKILLCDEPTAALDHESALIIQKTLLFLAKESLVLVVSHDEKLFSKVCYRHLTLEEGKVIKDQTIHSTQKTIHDFKKTLRKKKQKYKYILLDLRAKKGRVLMTLLAQSLAILILFTLFGMMGGMEKKLNLFKQQSIDKQTLILTKQDNQAFSEDELNSFKDTYAITYMQKEKALVNLTSDQDSHFVLLPSYPFQINGRLPQTNREILVSNDFAKKLGRSLDEIIDQSIELNLNGEKQSYVITGYTLDLLSTNTIYYPKIYLEDTDYQFYETSSYYFELENEEDVEQWISSLNKIDYQNDYVLFKKNTQDLMQSITISLMFFCFIVLMIAMMMTYLMNYASLLQKRKQFVILELFGFNKQEIYSMYLLEAIGVSLVSFVFSFIHFLGVRLLLNSFIQRKIDSGLVDFICIPLHQTFKLNYSFPFFSYFFILSVLILVSCLTTVLAVYGIQKQSKSIILREDELC